jgi:hypothetical protein
LRPALASVCGQAGISSVSWQIQFMRSAAAAPRHRLGGTDRRGAAGSPARGRGLGNREVAERLFVSRYTVETHLKHVFAKLGVSSRAELAAVTPRNT